MNGRSALGPKMTVMTVVTLRENDLFSYESKEMKFCAVFRIDLDSISALHFSVVDTFKGKKSVYGISIFLPASAVL